MVGGVNSKLQHKIKPHNKKYVTQYNKEFLKVQFMKLFTQLLAPNRV